MASLKTGVEKEEAEAKKAQEVVASEYELVKMRDEDTKTWLIRRRTDGELFLGFPWQTSPQYAGLLERGAGDAAAALLNHANLVNIINNIPVEVFRGSKDQVEFFSIWEFCDAGSLAAFMQRPAGTRGVPRQEVTREGRVKKFLPESLVWHVAISMLRALAWLHEGYREEPCIEWPGAEASVKWQGWRSEAKADGSMGEDWMPILHRNMTADNIFFQHPRGSETYGHCKLGNFSKVFVSGHAHNMAGGQVVCSEDDTVPLDKLRQHMAVQDMYTVPKNERPYFKGTELYHLGVVLYKMMTRTEVPDREECPLCEGRHHEPGDPTVARASCPFGKHFSVGDKLGMDAHGSPVDTVLEYTQRLRKLVYELLSQQYRGSGSSQVGGCNALVFLDQAKQGCEWWKGADEDGKLHRDQASDMLLRAQNRLDRDIAHVESAKRQSGPDALDVLDW